MYDVVTGSQRSTTVGSSGQFAGGAMGAANGVLYAVQETGALLAVRIATGSTLWDRSVPSNGFFTSIVIGGGAVYITDDNGTLYSLNAANGSSNWSYAAGGSQVSAPIAVGGLVT